MLSPGTFNTPHPPLPVALQFAKDQVAITANDFLTLLRQSNLLDHAGLEAAAEYGRLLEGSTAAELAACLVECGLLTAFQTRHLLQGRCRDLMVDGYKLLETLGAGSMGRVYLAEDIATGKQFAVKVLSERHRDEPGMLARFQLEAQAGRRLRHRSIVRTLGAGQTDGLYGPVPYVVMEYVDGVSLQELVALEGPIEWSQACDIAHQAATALDHAHDAGLIHRDIKPSNILVDRSGSIKILDFGLVFFEDEQEDEFSLSMIFGHARLGSADYVAPEQSLDSLAIDARADIYSLGCTLYFAITGTVPFPFDTTAKKLDAHRTMDPRPIGDLANLPDGLARVVERMMRKNAAERYGSAGELARHLAPFARRRRLSSDFAKVFELRNAPAEQYFLSDGSKVADGTTNVGNFGELSSRPEPRIQILKDGLHAVVRYQCGNAAGADRGEPIDQVIRLIEEGCCREFLFDMTAITTLPPGFLGLVASLLKRGLSVALENPSAEVCELLMLTEFGRLIRLSEGPNRCS